jgi:hypothetical protein
MSQDEIRHWLGRLHREFAWPWNTLARVCALGEGKHAKSKVRGNSRFVGGEQPRCSRQLKRIINGELVLSEPNSRGQRDAVLADNPTPLKGAAHMVFDLESGRIVWRITPLPQPTLTSFRKGIERFLGKP